MMTAAFEPKWMKPISASFKQALLASAVFGCCLGGGAPRAQDDFKLPDIGNSAGAVVAEHEERAYGAALMREFHRRAQTVDDPLLDQYIGHLGYRLVAQSDDPGRDFTFFIVDNDVVNAFAEREGCYVNCQDRVQHADWAVRPPAGTFVEGRLYWRLLGKQGLFRLANLRQEIAATIPFFASLPPELPPEGVSLREPAGQTA